MKKKLKKDIGKRLKEFRKSLKLSQERFAAKIFMNRTTYRSHEHGQNYLNVELLYALRTDFNVSLDWLICGTGSMLLENEASLKSGAEKFEMNDEVKELMNLMREIPFVEHSVMCFFQKFKIENKDFLTEQLNKITESGTQDNYLD